MPFMVIAGEDDIFTPLDFSKAFAEGIPGAQLATRPGAGHAVHWELLEQFNARSLEFTSTLQR